MNDFKSVREINKAANAHAGCMSGGYGVYLGRDGRRELVTRARMRGGRLEVRVLRCGDANDCWVPCDYSELESSR